jgi:Flp pilus assembly protein TadD
MFWNSADQQVIAVVQMVPLLAWAALGAGAETEAEALLDQAHTTATRQGYRIALLEIRRIQALLAVQQCRGEEAESRLEEALAGARAIGAPYREAKVHMTAGLVFARQGQRVRARQALEAALTILNELGERLYAEQVIHFLGQLNT